MITEASLKNYVECWKHKSSAQSVRLFFEMSSNYLCPLCEKEYEVKKLQNYIKNLTNKIDDYESRFNNILKEADY